jgi:hypothetical protein
MIVKDKVAIIGIGIMASALARAMRHGGDEM